MTSSGSISLAASPMMSSVILVRAMGAIALTAIPLRAPSIANTCIMPTRPILAAP
nr:hypothetical protein CPGR_02251 [Mycolicibacter nonchromogenicus]